MTAGSPPSWAAVDVVVVGRANIDLTVRIPRLPRPGETVLASELATTPGGKSLNQAVAVARLGGRSSLVANVGDDQWGRYLRTALAEAGVEHTQFRLLAGVRTGAAIIEVTPDGENLLVLAVSPATELSAELVTESLGRTDAGAVVVQLDMPPEPVMGVLSDPRPWTRIGNLVPHPAFDRAAMRRLDVFVVNQHEAGTILGRGDVAPLDAARELRRLGPSAVVVTAGPRGAAYSHGDQSGMVAAPQVPVIDTTGAGDAFLGSLALSLARSEPFPTAVMQAVHAGTEAVQHQGAQLPAFTQ